MGPPNVWVPTHAHTLIQDWLDPSRFRRLRVVNTGPREPRVVAGPGAGAVDQVCDRDEEAVESAYVYGTFAFLG